MNRLLFLAGMLLMVVAAFGSPNYRIVGDGPVNIYEGPSSAVSVIGTVNGGETVEVLIVENGWATLWLGNRNGYVEESFIAPLSDTDKVVTPESGGTAGVSDSETQFEKERKDGAFEFGYCAGTFDDVKESGSYGFGWTGLPWKLAPRLYAGYYISPLNFNFGLSEFTCDDIKLGPALAYYFTPKIFVAMPVDFICQIFFKDYDDTKVYWGMAIAPTVYLGDKWGLYVGPQLGIPLSGKADVSVGFRAGLYF